MAKKLIVIFIIATMVGFQFLFTTFVPASTLVPSTPSYPPDTIVQPPEQSREELYQDIFVSLLTPYIQGEVNQYYLKYLTEPPSVVFYQVFLSSAERPNGYRTGIFQIKLLVESFIGAHNSVGLDYITLTVDATGTVNIEKFEHVKSYVLPPNYEDIIRPGYTNPIP